MKLRLLSVPALILWICGGAAAADDMEVVGIVTAVQGTATMQPATMTPPVAVRPYDEVGPLAIFETQAASRCKILYQDDSLITLGETARLEVTEQRYMPGGETRAFVAHLSRGAVRALVGRKFETDNSTFEVHAGTAVATARGTYFVLWLGGKPAGANRREGSRRAAPDESERDQEGTSGVANIGRDGNVAFTSGGATVLVLPGQFSIALPGAPPTMPSSIQAALDPVRGAILGTQLPDSPKQETPKEALAAAGIGEAGGKVLLAGPSVARAGALGGLTPSTSYMLPDWPFPITPVTPPAVVSGAAAGVTTVNLNVRLP
jgi:hypothetical protein